jgi:peptide/nickel transport system substrate-binding protein
MSDHARKAIRNLRCGALPVRPAPVLALLLSAACGGDGGGGAAGAASNEAPGEPVSGGSVVICAQGQPESLNPFLSPDQLSVDLAPLVFTPLVRIGPDWKLEGHLAMSWSWTEEGSRLELKLRSDLQWHDGAPVSAEDVAWTIRTAADPAYGSWLAPDLETLESAEAIDPVTVEVRFREPFRPGLEPFAGIPVLPSHILADLGPEAFQRAPFHREPVGNGPFRVVSRAGDGGILFERSPEYPVELGPVRLERILFRSIPDENTMGAELRSGGVDLCVTGSATATVLEGVRGVSLEPLAPPSVFVVALNTSRAPLDDVRVRRALSAALIRADVASVISPLAVPSVSPLTPGSPWMDPGAGQPDADPRLADSLLTAAGWTRDGGGPRTYRTGEQLRLAVFAPGAFETPLTAVQALWRQLGVEADLRFMEWASYVRVLMDPDARPDAMALSFVEDRVLRPDFSGTYASGSPRNIASYRSADADRILAALDAASAESELDSLYRELQFRLADDVPILFVAYAPRVLAVGPRLEGVETGPGAPFRSAASWWVPESRRR